MNTYFFIAAIVSFLSVIGHFTIGRKSYLIPVLKSDANIIPKKVIHSIFHYISVYLVFSTLVLFNISVGQCILFKNDPMVAKFIGITYLGFALAQILVALFSKIPGGIFKLFQWVFWILIGIFVLLGL